MEIFRASIFFRTVFRLAMLAFSGSIFYIFYFLTVHTHTYKKKSRCSSDFWKALGFHSDAVFSEQKFASGTFSWTK